MSKTSNSKTSNLAAILAVLLIVALAIAIASIACLLEKDAANDSMVITC